MNKNMNQNLLYKSLKFLYKIPKCSLFPLLLHPLMLGHPWCLLMYPNCPSMYDFDPYGGQAEACFRHEWVVFSYGKKEEEDRTIDLSTTITGNCIPCPPDEILAQHCW